MKLAELVDARMKTVESLQKRLAEKPSAALAEKMGKESLAAQAEGIERRIAKLDQQRTAAVARIDAQLEIEHAALADLRKMAAKLPAEKGGKVETKPKTDVKAKVEERTKVEAKPQVDLKAKAAVTAKGVRATKATKATGKG